MEFGLILTQFTDRWHNVEGDARRAEEVGLDSIWLADHLLRPGVPDGFIFEAWSALGYLAGITERVRLGHLVNCVSFRNPGLLAKMAATLDIASNGRLELGLGAGWSQAEYEAFGYEFPSAGERRRYFAEYLDALLLLFEGGPVNFEGEFVTLRDAYCLPRPVQEPHPPIVVGTGGPMMRAIAGAKADVWNCPARLLPDLESARAVVMEAAAGRRVRTTLQIPVAVGRDRAEADAARDLAATNLAWMGDLSDIGISGTIDEAEEQVRRYQALGADGLTAVLPGSRMRPALIEAYGELASRF
jgi:alkanesulfonate monooxygenase SsuD/methylene tetrahydromethanopterin reductase-like flavin-dependent oxidoreductase (luciferase family)